MRHDTSRCKNLVSANRVQGDWCCRFYAELLAKEQPATPAPFLVLADTFPERLLFGPLLDDLAREGGPGRPDVILILFSDRPPREGEELTAWELLAEGVSDVYHWRSEADFASYVRSTLDRKGQINKLLNAALVTDNLVGDSAVWRTFLTSIIEAAVFSQSALLLTGESGTGKELLSRLVHTIDTRKKKSLVVLDCTTIVPELSGSEFFGHEKGAYTNAVQSRDGAFALANGGTLFLDEIGELPLALQAGLLRVVQEGKYKRVGSNAWQQTEFRLVCATHRNLRQYMDEGRFRQDLFFRISDFEFRVPPLRERCEDIPLLCRHFLKEVVGDAEPPEIDDTVMDFLVSRDYPGNVRELRQLIRRICLRHVNHKTITPGEIPPEDRARRPSALPAAPRGGEASIKTALLSGASLRDLKNRMMDDAITAALEITAGDKKAAADKLGVTMRAIQQFRKRVGTESAGSFEE